MNWLQNFVKLEASSGILLVLSAALAMIIKNSPLEWLYDQLLTIPVVIQVGALILQKPLLLWINDGLMAVFFLLIGLEVKREVLEGELSSKEQILLPAVGAVGGMAVPALLYLSLNGNDPAAAEGWAIPTATDIAFALGVIALLGKRIPPSLRIFLLALAIFDDLGAIFIIAIFYSADISALNLGIASFFIAGLALLNFRGKASLAPYMLLGIGLWIAVLKSGVHATIAGVVIGLFIPLNSSNKESPLRHLEHMLHPWVAFFIMPIFAFANSGVVLGGFHISMLLDPIPMGVWAGLFIGKQLGIFSLCGAMILMGWASLPKGVSWSGFYGISVLCGIGFTMSLFITSLAFEHSGSANQISADRLGILVGTLLSALVGYGVLRLMNPARDSQT